RALPLATWRGGRPGASAGGFAWSAGSSRGGKGRGPRGTCSACARNTRPCRSSGANTTPCASTTWDTPWAGTSSRSKETSRRKTAWCATRRAARRTPSRRSAETSTTLRPKRRWSASPLGREGDAELLNEPFRPQRGLHRRTAADAIVEREHVVERRQVHLEEVLPADHHEQISVRHGEAVADQEFLAVEHPIHELEASAELCDTLLARLGRQAGVEQRAVSLVNLGADERQRFLQPITLPRAVGRSETGFGFLVREELRDHRSFRENLAVVELERGHVALRIDGQVVAAGLRSLRRDIHFLQRERSEERRV